MSVSGKTTNLEIPYFLGTDKPPDMAAGTKAIADRVEAIFSPASSGGKLLIAQSTGAALFKALKGDATLAADGTLTIADGAVTSRSLKPTLGNVRASSSLTLTESFLEVPGTKLEITPAVPSLLVVLISVHMSQKEAGTADCLLNVDAVNQTARAHLANVNTGAVTAPFYVPYLLTLTAAKHTLKLMARKTGGAGAVLGEEETGSGYLYALFAS